MRVSASMFAALIGLAGLSALTGPALAMQADDVIIVTGQRIERYEDDLPPHVTVERRADALTARVRVVCDTRDETQRRQELRDTLRSLVRAGQANRFVNIGVLVERNALGDQAVIDIDEGMIDSLPVSGDRGRADISQIIVMATTAIGPEDTVDSASGRVNDFIGNIRPVGRTEVLNTGSWDLTVVGGPSRYRDEILTAIAADAHRIAAVFGENYDIEVGGLQSEVRWQRTGPMDLSFYIDYVLTVARED